MGKWRVTISSKKEGVEPVVLTCLADRISIGKDCIFIEREALMAIGIEGNQDGISVMEIK